MFLKREWGGGATFPQTPKRQKKLISEIEHWQQQREKKYEKENWEADEERNAETIYHTRFYRTA